MCLPTLTPCGGKISINPIGLFTTKYEAFYLRDFHGFFGEGSDRAIGWVHNTSYFWGSLGPVNDCIKDCIEDNEGIDIPGLPFGSVADKVRYDDLRTNNPGDNSLTDYSGIKLSIGDLKPVKRYEIEWYNTRSGLSTGITEVDWSSLGGVAKFDIPTWNLTSGYGDLAFKVRRYNTNSMTIMADSTMNEQPGADTTENIEVVIYPNPASDWLHIESNVTIQLAEIYTLQGKLLLQSEIGSSLQSIKLNLNTGYYLIKLYFKNGLIQTSKICVVQ